MNSWDFSSSWLLSGKWCFCQVQDSRISLYHRWIMKKHHGFFSADILPEFSFSFFSFSCSLFKAFRAVTGIVSRCPLFSSKEWTQKDNMHRKPGLPIHFQTTRATGQEPKDNTTKYAKTQLVWYFISWLLCYFLHLWHCILVLEMIVWVFIFRQ